jgi:hypothetical protein
MDQKSHGDRIKIGESKDIFVVETVNVRKELQLLDIEW